jgi:hypothetical protein
LLHHRSVTVRRFVLLRSTWFHGQQSAIGDVVALPDQLGSELIRAGKARHYDDTDRAIERERVSHTTTPDPDPEPLRVPPRRRRANRDAPPDE